ncbi:MAG: helix-turn-helix transcriptional regulator [Bacteroidales bacterium]|nr:helix-turn-helix transcriptional regulator [Bacteroidales bacterium]
MEFDFTVLKERRKKLKFTQQEVADAIGATVRTYQKWENGDTTPDGHYLLRLCQSGDGSNAIKAASQMTGNG